jgi:PAS domain S-box-containing protein
VARQLEHLERATQEQAGSGRSSELTAVDALPILVVDDRPDNLRTVQAALAPLGYPLHTATSGREALRLVLEQDYALILLDVRMPGLDGLETAELIKSRARTQDVPIVFLTAAHDEVGAIMRGYGIGAVDYLLKPFDPDILRSKVAVFAELEAGRRALKRSESFLRGAFEAAPIGKTVLDADRRIVRSNPAFARLVGHDPERLQGVAIDELCHADDRAALSAIFDRVSRHGDQPTAPEIASVDLRLLHPMGVDMWVSLVASAIDSTDLGEPMLLAQWVDLSSRRRAEQARADLLVEQAARGQAEAMADRLGMLQALTDGIEPLGLDDLLTALASRLASLFGATLAEVQVSGDLDEPVAVRAAGGKVWRLRPGEETSGVLPGMHEQSLLIQGAEIGVLRLAFAGERALTAAERSLLQDAADRVALATRRAQLHEEEHRIAVVLQRGLLPKTLPKVAGVEVAAHYEAAGLGAEVGGDWYDAFELPGERLGIVVGDVAGRSIPAASAMGQLRTVTRTLALGDDGTRRAGEVLTRLNRLQLASGDDELFTVIYAIVDPAERQIEWASAGHPPPLIRKRSGQTAYLEGGGGLTGIKDSEYPGQREQLDPGDALVLYTDGLVERRGESLDTGLERLAEAAAAGPSDPTALVDHMLSRLLPGEEELHDDVTALVARLSSVA